VAESCSNAITIIFEIKTISVSEMVFYFALVMRIAVNARSLNNTAMGAGYYTLHLCLQLVQQHPDVDFIFLTDVPVAFTTTKNSSLVILGSTSKGMFTLRRWLDAKLKKELKPSNADVFVSLDSTGSFTISTPQIIGITDIDFLQQGFLFTRYFKNKWFKKTLKKASSIITVSKAVKNQLIEMNAGLEEKISVIPKAPADIYKPLTWQERENIKTTYANGKEYFLFTGGFDPSKNLLNVLKAFSQFKKWQQSEMKLIIAGNTSNDSSGMMQKIETYKFRQDVVLLHKAEPKLLTKLLASSYSLVYPSLRKNYGMPVLEGMRCGTAVITSKNVAAAEMIGDAALYVDAEDPEDISAKMIKLYKDEDLRAKLVEDGLRESAKINWNTSAQLLWQLIEKTVQ
jgi:glycosyltransferase involved in cell wall biosynthesis